jgi:hypothetical protein
MLKLPPELMDNIGATAVEAILNVLQNLLLLSNALNEIWSQQACT